MEEDKDGTNSFVEKRLKNIFWKKLMVNFTLSAPDKGIDNRAR
jgi:hypothetical protein